MSWSSAHEDSEDVKEIANRIDSKIKKAPSMF